MERYDLKNISVLIAMQNQHMLKLLKTVLHELGVKTISYTTRLEQGYNIFRNSPVDIIFTDWTLGAQEKAFISSIRTPDKSPNPYAPIVILTSYTEPPNVIDARDRGVTDVLSMPFSAKSVYDHICRVITDHREFISVEQFFGPDRRHHKEEHPNQPKRKEDKEKSAVVFDEEPETP